MSDRRRARSTDARQRMTRVLDAEDGEAGLEQALADSGAPGACVAVIQDYEIDWAAAFGLADVVAGSLASLETLFQAASISKTVGAAVLVRAAEDGLIDLDADINLVLKSWSVRSSFADASNPVTARRLAGHVAGLGDGLGFPGYPPDAALPSTVQTLEGAAPSVHGPVVFDAPPMRSARYSGGGCTILQLALSDLYAEPFERIARRLVLDPIGMKDSTFDMPLSPEQDLRAARGHGSGGGPMAEKYRLYPELYAAGLWSTAADLARFVIDVQLSLAGRGGQVLSTSSARSMLSPVGLGNHAVGFAIGREGDDWCFAHSGSNQGFTAYMIGHMALGRGLVVLTNGEDGMRFVNWLLRRVSLVHAWSAPTRPL